MEAAEHSMLPRIVLALGKTARSCALLGQEKKRTAAMENVDGPTELPAVQPRKQNIPDAQVASSAATIPKPADSPGVAVEWRPLLGLDGVSISMPHYRIESACVFACRWNGPNHLPRANKGQHIFFDSSV